MGRAVERGDAHI